MSLIYYKLKRRKVDEEKERAAAAALAAASGTSMNGEESLVNGCDRSSPTPGSSHDSASNPLHHQQHSPQSSSAPTSEGEEECHPPPSSLSSSSSPLSTASTSSATSPIVCDSLLKPSSANGSNGGTLSSSSSSSSSSTLKASESSLSTAMTGVITNGPSSSESSPPQAPSSVPSPPDANNNNDECLDLSKKSSRLSSPSASNESLHRTSSISSTGSSSSSVGAGPVITTSLLHHTLNGFISASSSVTSSSSASSTSSSTSSSPLHLSSLSTTSSPPSSMESAVSSPPSANGSHSSLDSAIINGGLAAVCLSNDSKSAPTHQPATQPPTSIGSLILSSALINGGMSAAAAAAAAAAAVQNGGSNTNGTSMSHLNHHHDPHVIVSQASAQPVSQPSPSYLSAYQQQIRDQQAAAQAAAVAAAAVQANHDANQQMICMICEDRATGLHYGIITCEGCKGFFKRTVQNKRVYTCVADGQCLITKQQRNRCQYCRFQKCLRQGMVLAAVREDRMPGGRNSGAVYNLYKVKYRKHKKPGGHGSNGTPPNGTNGSNSAVMSNGTNGTVAAAVAAAGLLMQNGCGMNSPSGNNPFGQAPSTAASLANGHGPLLNGNGSSGGRGGSSSPPPSGILKTALTMPHRHQLSHLSHLSGALHQSSATPYVNGSANTNGPNSDLYRHLNGSYNPTSNSTSSSSNTSAVNVTAPALVNGVGSPSSGASTAGVSANSPPSGAASIATSAVNPAAAVSHLMNGFLQGNSTVASIARQMHLMLAAGPQELMGREESDQYLSALIDCDDFAEFGSLSSLELTETSTASNSNELSDRLCSIGDSIVYRLVQWTKRLPFYEQLPVHTHTQLLTHKWHELLVLSTCAFSAINSNTACIESLDAEIRQSMNNLAANLSHLNATSSGTVISCAQLELEAGSLVSELCSVRFAFKSIGLTLNEFVALKVIAMTSIIASAAQAARDQQANSQQNAAAPPQPDIIDPASVLRIRDRYLKALVSHLCHKKPPLGSGSCGSAALALLNGASQGSAGTLGPNTGHVLARMNSLLSCLAQVSSAANLLLQSKMFYVPFLMNSSSITSSAAATNGHYNPGLASHPSPPPSAPASAPHLPHHLQAHLGHLNQAAAAAAVAVAAAGLHHHHLQSHLNPYEHRNGLMPNGNNTGSSSGGSSRSASSSPPAVVVNGGVGPSGPMPPSSMANGPNSTGTPILASGSASSHMN